MVVDFRGVRHIPSPLHTGGRPLRRSPVSDVQWEVSSAPASLCATVARIVRGSLPTTTDIYTSSCRKRGSSIMKDPTDPLPTDSGTTRDCTHEAIAPGDIMIGGLFPIHESVKVSINADGTDNRTCDRFSVARLVQSLIMVQAVEEINKRQELGNLTMGYHIVDSCSDVTTALKNTMAFTKRNDRGEQSSPPVLAVIGGYYSEISIAVTRQLNLEYIPQISFGSTSGFLSDKVRFPSFMRTVPEDDHQARAIVEILRSYQWTWIGVITTDSDYGRYAFERLRYHADKNNICFAYTSILPGVLNHHAVYDDIDSTAKTIAENRNVSVIVSFAKPYHMMYLFNNLLRKPEGREKVWVCSDNWSQSSLVLNLKNSSLKDVGTVFGITLKSGNTSNMMQYLDNLDINPDHHKNNTFLYDFLKEKWESDSGEISSATEELKSSIYPYAVLSIDLALKAIVRAVSDLCTERDCRTRRLQPLELRDALQKAVFVMDGKNYSFDGRGDLDTGYDVILWRQTSPHFVDMAYTVAQYSIEDKKLIFTSKNAKRDVLEQTENVISRCSHSCSPGYSKKSADGQPVCCYECHLCPENYYSNDTDSTECLRCNTSTEYSSEDRSECVPKKTVFMDWQNMYHIVLLALTALGILLTLAAGIIFFVRWNTPVVRSCVGPICILLLFSLLGTFGSVILFCGRPNKWQCQARQVVFGLSFTLCISCVLVKSFKIILAFEFDPNTKRALEKLYKPYIIIAVCMACQILICALWLALWPPEPKWELQPNNYERVIMCDEKFFPLFGAMLSFIGLLALICLVVAFKGRKLPQCYNESKFITFSMLIYFIAWIIFAPVYVNVTGQYTPALEMVVILISAYGILFCQYLTKCYIILFRRNENTENAFIQDVRQYSLREDRAASLTSMSSDGIEIPASPMESLPTGSSSKLPTDLNASMNSDVSFLSVSTLQPDKTAE
ncbi:G-protein coupled receptor family C group 6 member A-like [Mugil cephalus]|uniref:G-protein coupled receptor family C group 6 member A-like n=1 Tax=Mugil cephalus TaxID=48193 RepID=UPI001FB72722|nr:G-protein coupled receptor family C group 6 member A-like [Mugil cephalus]